MRLALLFSLCAFLTPTFAHATDCPPDVKSCKVLILTPDEEAALVNPRGVFDTAAQARQLDLANVVAYFRQKLATAPAGVVAVPPTGAGKENPLKPEVAPEPKAVPIPQPDPRK